MVKAQNPPACLGVLEVLDAILVQNDTFYVCVGTPITFEDASLLDGLLSVRNWDFGDGTVETNALISAQTTHSYDADGIYTVTLTVDDILGCTPITVSQTIVALGSPIFGVTVDDVSCFGECDGQVSMDLVSDNAPLYNITWDILGVPSSAASGLCAGSYTATITDGLGCTNLSSGNVEVPEPEELLANIGLSDTINLCPTGTFTDIPITILGGSGGNVVDWGSAGSMNVVSETLSQFMPMANNLDQMYYMTMQDMNGCTTEDSIYIRSTPSFLQGQVTVGPTPCNDCKVYQFKYDPNPGLWDIIDSTTTDASGAYDFGLIENLLPFALMADPNELNHPGSAAGFHPEGHQWSTASILSDVCGMNLSPDISLREPMVYNGTNTLKGNVWYLATGKTETEEDPIPLIDVVVEKTPPSQSQGREGTDIDGFYEFDFVPNNDTTYTLYVSMPGVPVTSTYEIIATGNQIYCELDFCLNIDSTEIVACNSTATLCAQNLITSEHSVEDGFHLYPNPTNGRFVIETGVFAETRTEILITDLTGRQVFRKEYNEAPYYVTMVDLAQGYYMVRLSNQREADALPISVQQY